jgi:AcrR family transcriptional regulator
MNAEPLRKGEATQARIVDVAYALFLRQGYHGTSMRQIADAAGITMGGIYNHFPSKEAIWQAVLSDRHPYREILPLLTATTGESAEAYVRDAATRLVAALGQRRDLLHLMFIELVEFDGAHIPSLYAAITPHLLQLADMFTHKAGQVRPIPLPILARSFAGLFFSYYITDIMMPPDVRALMGDDALDSFVDIYLHGILAHPAAQPLPERLLEKG